MTRLIAPCIAIPLVGRKLKLWSECSVPRLETPKGRRSHVVDGGRTELICVFCDRLDLMEIELTNKWAGEPTCYSYFRASPLNELRPRTACLWTGGLFRRSGQSCSALKR
jgi:hypothetical protein